MKTALISAVYRKSLKMLQTNGKLGIIFWRSGHVWQYGSSIDMGQEKKRLLGYTWFWELSFWKMTS